MTSPFILISFYNTGGYFTNQRWSVYGHYGIDNNDHLGDFDTKESAVLFANDKYRLPVIQGQGASIEELIEKLLVGKTK